jgi:uncharacterized protein (DUF1501 family)
MQTLQNIYSQAGNWSAYESLIRRGTLEALTTSDHLQSLAASYQTPIAYPANNGLANQLKLVAQVIAGNLGTRLFSVSMGGFDTHANQRDTQATLLADLGKAVNAFMLDLASMGRQDDVTLMTFSEFGRRVHDNGSGTDHGAGGVAFALGEKVKGGHYGEMPSLKAEHLVQGDLNPNMDFRSVYSTILDKWLKLNPAPIVNGTFEQPAFLN